MGKELMGPFARLTSKRILVLGDLMLDAYTYGKVKRISPEAPVPIVNMTHDEELPGGAGNVVLNLRSLGCEVELCARVGNDAANDTLRACFDDEKVLFHPLVDKNYRTPVKHRIIADNQQLIRIDREEIVPLSIELENSALKIIESRLPEIDIVALSDYGKGFLTASFCKSLIKLAKKFNKPVIADPKGIDFSKYEGVDLLKPNRKEAYEAAHLSHSTPVDEVANKLLEITKAKGLIITLSEEGIALYQPQGKKLFPVKAKEVKDVTGAGDTVLAMLVHAYASNLSIDDAIKLANVAASIAIEVVGCARITLQDLARRLLEIDVHNKVFEESHLFALSHALKGESYNIIELHPNTALSPELYQELQKYQLKPLIVNFKSSPNPLLVDLLASLREVNYILIGEPQGL